jgi:hypothetical protein
MQEQGVLSCKREAVMPFVYKVALARSCASQVFGLHMWHHCFELPFAILYYFLRLDSIKGIMGE